MTSIQIPEEAQLPEIGQVNPTLTQHLLIRDKQAVLNSTGPV